MVLFRKMVIKQSTTELNKTAELGADIWNI